MNAAQIKQICQTYNITPSKVRGQNFLIDQNIVNKIIKAAKLNKTDSVLEIGPGLGVLTKFLVLEAGQVVAIEADSRLYDFLSANFINTSNLNLIKDDALAVDLSKLDLQPYGYKIVSNLPYSITAKFLWLYLEQELKPQEMIIMIQKEVAERLLAKPGQMSLLSLSVQFYGQPEILFKVDKNCFWPTPKVDSAVVKIKVNQKLPKVNVKKLFQLARIGFAAKRKQLQNNLSVGLRLENQQVKEVLIRLGLDERIRAQDLSVEDWKALSNCF